MNRKFVLFCTKTSYYLINSLMLYDNPNALVILPDGTYVKILPREGSLVHGSVKATEIEKASNILLGTEICDAVEIPLEVCNAFESAIFECAIKEMKLKKRL